MSKRGFSCILGTIQVTHPDIQQGEQHFYVGGYVSAEDCIVFKDVANSFKDILGIKRGTDVNDFIIVFVDSSNITAQEARQIAYAYCDALAARFDSMHENDSEPEPTVDLNIMGAPLTILDLEVATDPTTAMAVHSSD